MKKLEELGISPAPWKARMDFWIDDADGDFVFTDSCVTNLKGKAHQNAYLIAAAPELYNALRDAVKSYCEGCNDFVNGDQICNRCDCLARKWRAVLAEAAGESEVTK